MASRSLGTLTLDLIAKVGGFEKGLDKAGRKAKTQSERMKKEFKQLGVAIGSMATAAAGSLVLMTKQTIDAAREVTTLAQVANTGYKEFQRYAAGAKFMGVEQDKLADIFKDTSDKVGDFIQNGGGPLADFFENIAPQVGVTAEQFRNLSGPQALGLYVDSLEKANLSQNDMTFYMEAIASDATLLLPLLRNNAEGFKLFGDQAERAGAVLGDNTIKNAETLRATLFLMEQSTQGMKNGLVAAALPVLSDLAAEFSNVAADGSVATAVGKGLANVIKVLAAAAVGAVASFDLAGKAIGGFTATVGQALDGLSIDELTNPIKLAARVASNLDKVKTTVEVSSEDLKASVASYASVLDGIWGAGSGEGGGSEELEKLKGFLAQRDAIIASYGGGNVSGGGAANDDTQDRLDRLRESFMTEQELLTAKYETEQELLRESLESKLLTEQEYQALTLQSNQAYEDALTAVKQRGEQARIAAVGSALSTISTLMNGESRKLFEIGKAAAIAQATISMYQGIMAAWALGPILGPILAPLVAVAGAANIRGIASTKFGGGSAAVSNTQSINNASTGVGSAGPTRNVYLHGIDPNMNYSGTQLLDLLNGELMNGGRLVGVNP